MCFTSKCLSSDTIYSIQINILAHTIAYVNEAIEDLLKNGWIQSDCLGRYYSKKGLGVILFGREMFRREMQASIFKFEDIKDF